MIALLAKLVAGCTYVDVPGRFTLIDTKDNSVKLDAASYDPATRGVVLKGFELTNNASGPINAYAALIAQALDRLDALVGRVAAAQAAAASAAASQPAPDARFDRLLSALEAYLRLHPLPP